MNPLTTHAPTTAATDTGVTDRKKFLAEINKAMQLWEKDEYEKAREAALSAMSLHLPADAKGEGEEYILGIPISSIPERQKCGEVLNALHTRENTFHAFLEMGLGSESDVNAAVMEARGDVRATLGSVPEVEAEDAARIAEKLLPEGGGSRKRKRKSKTKRRRKSKTKKRRKTKTKRRRRR